MGGVMNGMAAHGGVIPVGGTFFVFSDYMRPAVRLAAMSEYKVVFSFTHDSVGLGEDGPTHQPIEHLASLRAMPQLRLIRPADANETVAGLAHRPRVRRPHRAGAHPPGPAGARGHRRPRASSGAPTCSSTPGDPTIVLIGTGSEVAVCVDAAALLAADGLPARVVSMPSWDLFAVQDDDYQDLVLPPRCPRWRSRPGPAWAGTGGPTTA